MGGVYPPQGAVGVTRLSQLIIDISKNWGGYNITNLGAGAHDVNSRLNLVLSHASRHALGGADELSIYKPLDPASVPNARMDRFSMAYYDGTYWVCRNCAKVGSISSILWAGKL